jgi:SAM-dependent methyltransferase
MSESTNDRLRPRPTQANYILLRRLATQLERALERSFTGRGSLDVLDVGCGTKPYESLFDGLAGRYVGLDMTPGPGVDVVGSADALPFEAASFDCVLSSQVLEHVVDPRRVIEEMHRVLRPGGVALVSTHGVVRYHAAADRKPDDFRRWTHAGLALELNQAADWAAITVEPNGGTAGAFAFLLGRELEATLGSLGARAGAKPLAFALNLFAWHADRAFRRRYPDRPPELAANYLVTALK